VGRKKKKKKKKKQQRETLWAGAWKERERV